jgi:hypothetical protein
MLFEPNYFSYASIKLTVAHYQQCQAQLRACFVRDWVDARPEPTLAVPLGVAAPTDITVPRGLPRSWATTPPDMIKLGLRTHRLLRVASAQDDALTAALVTRHLTFTRAVELLLFDVADRLRPWGATVPEQIEWVVSSAGPPTVLDLGIALSPTSYSLEDALDDASHRLAFEVDDDMPDLWSRTLGDAIRWEVAAALELKIPKHFGAPGQIVDRSFHELKNPFLQLCNLWRSGVVALTSFDAAPALLGVNARRL